MKEFLKNISIYGIIPVLGKFLGFFLIPIYARVFNSSEFGTVELVVTLIHFIVFACNLEMYSAIGRYFYEKNTLQERKKLISTGLILTIFASIMVCAITFLCEDFIYDHYFKSSEYQNIFRVSIIWLFLSAISTYLSIIPRYEKRAKLYVTLNLISLIIRLLSTIFFVLVAKVGIIGVIYGHICGAASSLLLNGIISRKYLAFHLEKENIRLILKFALPLVPGLLLIGLWPPISRNLMNVYFSASVIGLFAFASRFTAINSIFNGALRNAWQPMLFENINNLEFGKHLQKISGFSILLTLGIGITLTLFSPELCTIIGTEEYADAAIFIGFLSLIGTLSSLTQIRGFGPLIYNKTYISSVVNILSVLLGILLFFIIGSSWGLIGLGLTLLLKEIFNYLCLTEYTRKKTGFKFYNSWELVYLLLIVVAQLSIIFNVSISYRVPLYLVFIAVTLYIFKTMGGVESIAKTLRKRN